MTKETPTLSEVMPPNRLANPIEVWTLVTQEPEGFGIAASKGSGFCSLLPEEGMHQRPAC